MREREKDGRRRMVLFCFVLFTFGPSNINRVSFTSLNAIVQYVCDDSNENKTVMLRFFNNKFVDGCAFNRKKKGKFHFIENIKYFIALIAIAYGEILIDK